MNNLSQIRKFINSQTHDEYQENLLNIKPRIF